MDHSPTVFQDTHTNSYRALQADQVSTIESLNLFYQPPNDVNFYHTTCKMILQIQDSSLEDDYDYEFFFQNYHVTCKLLPHSLIVDILNKEIYGIDFDVNDLKRKCMLTLYQKLNLEFNFKESLKQILKRFVSFINFILR
jgi:hypothetical protein